VPLVQATSLAGGLDYKWTKNPPAVLVVPKSFSYA